MASSSEQASNEQVYEAWLRQRRQQTASQRPIRIVLQQPGRQVPHEPVRCTAVKSKPPPRPAMSFGLNAGSPPLTTAPSARERSPSVGTRSPCDASIHSCTPSLSSSSSSSSCKLSNEASSNACTSTMLACLQTDTGHTFVSTDLSQRAAMQRHVAAGEEIPPDLLGLAIVPYNSMDFDVLPPPVRKGAATSLRRWAQTRLRRLVHGGARAPPPLMLLDEKPALSQKGASLLRSRRTLKPTTAKVPATIPTIKPSTTESLEDTALQARLDALLPKVSAEHAELEARLVALLEDYSETPTEQSEDLLGPTASELQSRIVSLLDRPVFKQLGAPSMTAPKGSAAELAPCGSSECEEAAGPCQKLWSRQKTQPTDNGPKSRLLALRQMARALNHARIETKDERRTQVPHEGDDAVQNCNVATGISPQTLETSRESGPQKVGRDNDEENPQTKSVTLLPRAPWKQRRPTHESLSADVKGFDRDQPKEKPRRVKFVPRDEPCVIVDVERVLVVYKPPHWTSTTPEKNCRHGLLGAPKIQEWLLDNFVERIPFLANDDCSNGLCQRLDIQTSGPMIIAKDQSAWREMRAAVGNAGNKKSVRKEYYALMHGKLPSSFSTGILTYPIKTFKQRSYKKVRKWAEVHWQGDPAETRYKTIRYYREGRKYYTLLNLQIVTGRTHQIRVHVAELAKEARMKQCGIVGDYLYLSRKQLGEDRKLCSRVFLHARLLKFSPPGQQGSVHVECGMPSDLEAVLDRLSVDDEANESLKSGRRRRRKSTGQLESRRKHKERRLRS